MKRIILLTFCFAQLQAQQIDYKGLPEWSWQKEGETEYYLYTPSGIKPGVACPLAIFLHGCCGEDHHATLRNCVDPPARMWHNFGANTQLEPTYIIAPKTTRGWEQKFPDIKTIIDKMVSSGLVDKQRVYMTGFSMGGGGTWEFIEQYPGYIAAAIPMAMNPKVDTVIVKNTPVWAIRGELDYYGRGLPEKIAEIRKLNGDDRGSLEWETGVNPMFTDFEGLGHGIQWDAASELELLSWAYSKINDGNTYPVIYFISPGNKQEYQPGEQPLVKLFANDPDGKITRIDLFVNNKLMRSFKGLPYEATISIDTGNNIVEAVAFDDKGKSTRSGIIVKTDIKPVFINTQLAAGIQGGFYEEQLAATGNDPMTFQIANESTLPEGLTMDRSGKIKGITVPAGNYPITICIMDEDGDVTNREFVLKIHPKNPGEVIVTDVFSMHDSLINIISKMKIGEFPNTQAGTEVSFNKVGSYEEVTFISTSSEAANFSEDSVLMFIVDEDVKVYIAYEKLDLLFTSTIPEWLNSFTREPGPQIEAQYHYFDVYSKSFPAGKICLPGADAQNNNVIMNYFVMIRKGGIK